MLRHFALPRQAQKSCQLRSSHHADGILRGYLPTDPASDHRKRFAIFTSQGTVTHWVSFTLPAEFVGRGDMRRERLMLRHVSADVQPNYVPVAKTQRHGPGPRSELLGSCVAQIELTSHQSAIAPTPPPKEGADLLLSVTHPSVISSLGLVVIFDLIFNHVVKDRSSCDGRWILRQRSCSLNAGPTEPAQPNAEISR